MVLAQQASPGTKRLCFLVTVAETDPGASKYVGALKAGLAAQGWVEGKNLTIDYRFGSSLAADAQRFAQQLIDLKPDVLVSVGLNNATALANATSTIPIVFGQVVDSVGARIIGDLAHPVGNATGFLNSDDLMFSGKLLELLKELSPDLKRAGYLYPGSINALGLPAFDAAAKTLGVQAVHLDLDGIPDLASAIADFALEPASGLVIESFAALLPLRQQLYVAIARLQLPVVWGAVLFALDGAPVVYTIDTLKLIQGGGEYAGRVLNGEKIANLPAQLPLMYSLIINLKTAKAMGMTIPQSPIIRADQVIE
jgi:putative ABC transport system substrate-binding protein